MGTRGRAITGMCAAATLLALLPAAASAQRYASTTGTPADDCSKADPCDVTTAVEGALDGFDVYILPGTYTVGSSIDVINTISVTGAGTGRTILNTSGPTGIFVNGVGTDAVVQDLTVNHSGSLEAIGAAGANSELNRVIARSATSFTTCALYRGGTIRDSICSSTGDPAGPDRALFVGGGLSDGAYTVRNVTAYNAGTGFGIIVEGAAGTDISASIRNTIADAPAGVGFNVNAVGGATAFAGFDYSLVSSETVTGAGGRSYGSNMTSLPPQYVNAPYDLHLTASSGLRNRGSRYYASPVDVDGDLRTQEGTSIGADEYVAPPVTPVVEQPKVEPQPPVKRCKKGQKLKKGKCVKKKRKGKKRK